MRFYMTDVSDRTAFGKLTWKDLKLSVCDGESYQKEEWFLALSEDMKELLEALKKI